MKTIRSRPVTSRAGKRTSKAKGPAAIAAEQVEQQQARQLIVDAVENLRSQKERVALWHREQRGFGIGEPAGELIVSDGGIEIVKVIDRPGMGVGWILRLPGIAPAPILYTGNVLPDMRAALADILDSWIPVSAYADVNLAGKVISLAMQSWNYRAGDTRQSAEVVISLNNGSTTWRVNSLTVSADIGRPSPLLQPWTYTAGTTANLVSGRGLQRDDFAEALRALEGGADRRKAIERAGKALKALSEMPTAEEAAAEISEAERFLDRLDEARSQRGRLASNDD